MFSLIAAVAKNNCIGKNNQLPWHIPEDLEHFKKLTKGKVVLMGRKTFESILSYQGKPLPNRTNIVITKDAGYKAPEGVEVFHSIEQAIQKYKNKDVFVIGGAQIYSQTINLADTLYITQINEDVEGNAFFPVIDKKVWKEVEREEHEGFSFIKYER